MPDRSGGDDASVPITAPRSRRWGIVRVVRARARGVGAAALVGLVVRVVWQVATAHRPNTLGDPLVYLAMADRATDGHWFSAPTWPFGAGGPTSFLSVGYPTILAGLNRATFGLVSPFGMALAINLVSSAALILGVAALGARFARGVDAARAPTAAVAAAWLMALSPDAIVATSLVMNELPASAALVWAVVLFDRLVHDFRRGDALACGGLLGLTIALRPSVQLLAPLFVVVAAVVAWRAAPAARARAARATVAMAVVCVVVLAPIAWNSTVRVDAGPGLTSATWVNICDGAFADDGRFRLDDACHPSRDVVLNDPGYESAWVSDAGEVARRRIADAPAHWLSVAPLRVVHSFDLGGWAVEVGRDWSGLFTDSTRYDTLLRLSQAGFVAVSALGLAGVALHLARRRRDVDGDSAGAVEVGWPGPLTLCAVVAVGTLAGSVVTFGQPRFGWYVTVCCAIPFAGVAIASLPSRFVRNRASDDGENAQVTRSV